MNPKIIQTMVQLATMIANREYQKLESLSGGVRLSAHDIAARIKEYGRTVTTPPSEVTKLIDIVPVKGSASESWSVQMPLWTKEEGRSDLTLEVTLKTEGDRLVVELDDLHVL